MNYLRFINGRQEETEFFADGISVRYLSNVKDINIIIGANNTRKSRFIRKVISLEHKVIIKSEHELNKLLQGIHSIFEGVEPSLIDLRLIELFFNEPQNPSLEYIAINNYFSNQISGSRHLTFFDIRNTLRNLHETVELLAVEDNVKAFTTIASSANATFTFLLKIYKELQTSFRFWDTQHPTPVPGINYKITAGFTGDKIDDIDQKIKLLMSAVEYTKLFSQLEFELHHKDMMVYIPVLRTSRRLIGATADLFKKTIQSQHKLGENAKLTIETGLDLYDKIEIARNGHRSDREKFSAFEKFVSDIFFNSRPIDIIAVKSAVDTERHVKISIDGEQDDIAIHNLGDGIQAVINLLLPVFTARDESWIFIDEPENHLHPGYQNILINAVSNNEHIRNKKLKFFINTHSNHILSESLLGSAQTEIFVFSKKDKDSSNIMTFDGNEYSTLEMLGVFNTSVLVSNVTIWVEGITDRLYVKGFLSAYYADKEDSNFSPTEGLNYTFIEYAGSNLLHYTFDHNMSNKEGMSSEGIKSFFINSNVFLLADSDFDREEKHEFYKNLEKRKNFKYFQTGLPEIENLIPDKILKSWLLNDLKCKKDEIDACFSIAISNEKLGNYFEGKFTRGNKKRKFTTTAIGGTLRSDLKQKLADFVYRGIMNKSISWADLKESVIIDRLVDNLTVFIEEKNSIVFT